MHRAEIVCRVLAGLLLWCGMVGLAWYILWSMGDPLKVERLGYGAHLSARGWLVSPSYTRGQDSYAADELVRNVPAWTTWYYSPLNLHYWAMAMLFFAPALGCWLLARGLAWRRKHQMGRPTL